MQVELKYIPQDAQKIKTNVDITLDPHHRRTQKNLFLNFDLLKALLFHQLKQVKTTKVK